MATDDPFDRERIVAAPAPVVEAVLAELRAGHKRRHWICSSSPRLHGLGRSPSAMFYGIGSLDEARTYLAHGVLGRGRPAQVARDLTAGRATHHRTASHGRSLEILPGREAAADPPRMLR